MKEYNCVDYKLFGERIRKRRGELKLKQHELAELMDCNESYISKIETGKARPSLDFTCLLAQHLNVGVDYFVLNTPAGQEILKSEYHQTSEVFSPSLQSFINSIIPLAQRFEKDIDNSNISKKGRE